MCKEDGEYSRAELVGMMEVCVGRMERAFSG